ncbi:MAG: hypothetical protein ABIB79_03695 [archaeon]
MKRVILICLLLGFSLLFVFINRTSLAPSEQTDVSVNVDALPPIINIITPQEINYNNATPTFINYTIQDLSHDSTWYSLNEGPNIAITGYFYLNLAEGNYNLKVYANDSFGRINFSEVQFTVNNSLPYCGNDYCDLTEDCSSCPEDCGNCPPTPPSSSGGGSGGGGGSGNDTPPPVNDSIITKDSTITDETPGKDDETKKDEDIDTAQPKQQNWIWYTILTILLTFSIFFILYHQKKKRKKK